MSAPMAEARRILSQGLRDAQAMTARAQAEAAFHVGGPSVDELERLVLEHRAQLAAPRLAA